MAANQLEQAMVQLQTELAQTREQLGRMAASHDNLQHAHLALRSEADGLFRQQRDEIQRSEETRQASVHSEV